MSVELVAQWAKRVSDAEEEARRMQEDIDAVKQQRRTLKAEIRKYEDIVASEKHDLLASLERVEAQAKELGAQCDAALAEKDRVEAEYVAALDEYEKLHFFVRDIQDAEERLQSREDLEAKLQRDSLEWAEEEHALRRQLHQLQQQQSQARRTQQAELQEAEAQLASVERRQREARAARCGEVQEATTRTAAAVVRRSSRPPAPSAEESAFLHANAGGAVPTRAAPLRSCLRTSMTAAGSAGSNSGAFPVNATASAPVSRCASQSLLAESGPREGEGGTANAAAATMPSLQVLQKMRALSYAGPGKPGSRKREFLGEATNEQ
ncbi:hypothetical protein ABB37_09685 [Leptomonas pyrrhocoris]|uniref:Uncharacterized protein n=1 Tax=Leptomonas pyrrhocoris TaxID=157538 RepID=A0A0M9FQ58_LEPPY|nr:hypothetical protein ABB37_09685 [Leptomonas pyrrhocoris]XP_015652244.1 hypothetical protein ABB37_09685 [Leptomonas pyrrhocoris]KPA73804.1 hypothetical protein ABB37_09685 [Leptomonas pyrrhocoris]KPA73805.1 hypothetical protein ABB37_09685 [Leptomonas pyrrhocoris]|eukprot:XP_015652243.1 hypothetical protein ABB37_09685 [Leptomonas pyrrhocoris]